MRRATCDSGPPSFASAPASVASRNSVGRHPNLRMYSRSSFAGIGLPKISDAHMYELIWAKALGGGCGLGASRGPNVRTRCSSSGVGFTGSPAIEVSCLRGGIFFGMEICTSSADKLLSHGLKNVTLILFLPRTFCGVSSSVDEESHRKPEAGRCPAAPRPLALSEVKLLSDRPNVLGLCIPIRIDGIALSLLGPPELMTSRISGHSCMLTVRHRAQVTSSSSALVSLSPVIRRPFLARRTSECPSAAAPKETSESILLPAPLPASKRCYLEPKQENPAAFSFPSSDGGFHGRGDRI